eukprot:s1404_g16.t1
MLARHVPFAHLPCKAKPRVQVPLRLLSAPNHRGYRGAWSFGTAVTVASLPRLRELRPRRWRRNVAMASSGPDVVVYSRPGCGYCAKAKALLRRRQVNFGVVDVGAEPQRRAEAQQHGPTFPQILVGSRCLGGFDALELLEKQGKLLDATKRTPEDEVYITPTPPEKIVAAALPEAIQQQLLQRAEEMGKLKYQAGSKPTLSGFLRYAITRTPRQDQSQNVPLNLAVAPGAPEPPAALPEASAEELAALLRQSMLQLLENFSDPESGDVNYVAMRQSAEWNLFRALAAELGQPRLQSQLTSMPPEERKAFFINIYNAMTFHGVTTFGRRSGVWYLYCFFITPAVSYRVAGTQMSLDDIEHGLLRVRPNYFEEEGQELQRELRMPSVDPRIHMALNCGAKSCPAIAVYSGKDLSSELETAVAGFVADDGNVLLQDTPKLKLGVTELFKMYLEDFIGEKSEDTGKALAQWILPYATGEKKTLLERATQEPVQLEWLPYDWETNGPDVPLDNYIYSVF